MSPLRSGETFDGGSEDRAAGPMPNAGKRGLRREIEDAFPHVFLVNGRVKASSRGSLFVTIQSSPTTRDLRSLLYLVLFTRSRI